MRLNRRRALQGLSASAALGSWGMAGIGAGACAGPVAPEKVDLLGLAQKRIGTFVVVMMENRSFDHAFGSLSLVEGRSDVDGLLSSTTNPDAAGALITAQQSDLACINDPPHGWESSHRQWNAGACDGFVTEYGASSGGDAGTRVMDYLPATKQTASRALGLEYALCQRWFASVMGPTWPNRFHMLTCTSQGIQTNTFLPQPQATIFSVMDKAKVQWANYYGNVPFAVTIDVSTSFPEVEPLQRFFDDAAAGVLPPVVIIDPVYGRSDDHPPSHPVAGQLFIQSIYDALRTSPQWNESLLAVTYDEHGGFHDHVPPPTTVDDFAAEGFDQLGFRVPSFVVGPFVKKQVSDVVFDHTSIYATIAALHGLDPIRQRDAAANNLLGLLDEDLLREDKPRAGLQLAPIVADESEIFAESCRGFSFHGHDEVGSVTGQPELEAALANKSKHRFDRLRADTDGVWKDLVDRARSKGLLKLM